MHADIVLQLLQLRRPLVSGTNLPTRMTETMLISTKSPKVGVAPTASRSSGKTKEMMVFVVQSTNTINPHREPADGTREDLRQQQPDADPDGALDEGDETRARAEPAVRRPSSPRRRDAGVPRLPGTRVRLRPERA